MFMAAAAAAAAAAAPCWQLLAYGGSRGGEPYWGGMGLEAWAPPPAGESPEVVALKGDMFRDNNVGWFSMSSNISFRAGG